MRRDLILLVVAGFFCLNLMGPTEGSVMKVSRRQIENCAAPHGSFINWGKIMCRFCKCLLRNDINLEPLPDWIISQMMALCETIHTNYCVPGPGGSRTCESSFPDPIGALHYLCDELNAIQDALGIHECDPPEMYEDYYYEVIDNMRSTICYDLSDY